MVLPSSVTQEEDTSEGNKKKMRQVPQGTPNQVESVLKVS